MLKGKDITAGSDPRGWNTKCTEYLTMKVLKELPHSQSTSLASVVEVILNFRVPHRYCPQDRSIAQVTRGSGGRDLAMVEVKATA